MEIMSQKNWMSSTKAAILSKLCAKCDRILRIGIECQRAIDLDPRPIDLREFDQSAADPSAARASGVAGGHARAKSARAPSKSAARILS